MGLAQRDLGVQRLRLLAGWECRTAATLQAGIQQQFPQHTCRSKIEGFAQGLVATETAIVVDIRWIDCADPAEETQLWLAGLRDRNLGAQGVRLGGKSILNRVFDRAPQSFRCGGGDYSRVWVLSGFGDESGGRSLTQPQARTTLHNNAGKRKRLIRPRRHAGDVLAEAHDYWRPLLKGEHIVKRGNAMHLGRRKVKALGDVIHGALADPADALLNRMQCGQQQVSAGAGLVSGKGHTPIPFHRLSVATLPERGRLTQLPIDRGPFLARCSVAG